MRVLVLLLTLLLAMSPAAPAAAGTSETGPVSLELKSGSQMWSGSWPSEGLSFTYALLDGGAYLVAVVDKAKGNFLMVRVDPGAGEAVLSRGPGSSFPARKISALNDGALEVSWPEAGVVFGAAPASGDVTRYTFSDGRNGCGYAVDHDRTRHSASARIERP